MASFGIAKSKQLILFVYCGDLFCIKRLILGHYKPRIANQGRMKQRVLKYFKELQALIKPPGQWG